MNIKPVKRKIATTALTESEDKRSRTEPLTDGSAPETANNDHVFKRPFDPLPATKNTADTQSPARTKQSSVHAIQSSANTKSGPASTPQCPALTASSPAQIQQNPAHSQQSPSSTTPLVPQGAPIKVTLSENFQNHCGIARLEAKNFAQNTLSSCRLLAFKRNGNTAWTSIILTKITNVVANQYWAVTTSHSAQLFCYETKSGKLIMSLWLDSAVSRLLLNEHFCAVQNKNNEGREQILVWDLRQKKIIGAYKIPEPIARNSDRMCSVVLSRTGLPVITLKSGEILYFSRSCNEWRQVQTGINLLTSIMSHLEFIQKVVPGGFISNVILNRRNLKLPTIASAYIAEETEDEQIDLLLSALDELDYPEEYTLLSSVYVNRLVSKGNTTRLSSYLETLDQLSAASKVDVGLIRGEVTRILEQYPMIKRGLEQLPEQADDEFVDDLGFLTSSGR